MTPELFRRAREIFDRAVELPAGDRGAFLDGACDDPELRVEVEALLRESGAPALADGLRATLSDLAAPAARAASSGRRIGAWEVAGEIGRGGMGTVFLARRADGSYEKEVALKLVSAGLDTAYVLRRFVEERRILASLTHPNIAMLLDGGTTDDGLPYFVMEYVAGDPIDVHCAERRLSRDETLGLFRSACAAVQHAHAKKIVHRDLKPSNILVTAEGVPKLLDFGLARVLTPESGGERTATDLRALTPAYASPEQIRGAAVTTSSDVYSLGVVLYRLVTGGRRPYPNTPTDDYAALLHAAVAEEPVRPALAAPGAKIPRDLEAIVLKAMRKGAEDRYATAGELGDDVGRLLDGRPVLARAGTVRYRARIFARRHKAALGAAAVAVLSLAAGSAALLSSSRREPPAAPAPTTLAVLPFKPLGEGDRDVVLEIGMADTLITRLSGVPGIVLRPVGAVLRESGDGGDPVALARRLRVDAVVEGSLQRVEDRLRVSVRLVNVADGRAVWGETFDTPATDVFGVEDAIAQRVAEALLPRLGNDARERLAQRGTADVGAYNAYLKGRYFWGRRTEADFRKAIAHFRQAIVADPGYALAHAGLADCYSLLSVWGAAPPKEALESARAAAHRAIAGADAPGEAWASAAFVRWIYDWDWAGADEAFRRSIAKNPGYATAWQWYAYYLASRARFGESVGRIRRAQELDPLSVSIATDAGELLCWAGRYEEAVPQLRAALDMEPNFALAWNILGVVHLRRGDLPQAIAALERALALDDSPRMLATLGHAYALAGRARDARALAARLEALSKTRYTSPFQLALIHAGLREDDRAFALLRTAYEERSDNMVILPVYPLLERLRRDPRFAGLLQDVNGASRKTP